jgi:hypothetical protein
MAHKGFFREPLLVVVEGSRKVVYEGNRRLCALKVLDNPSLAPENYRKRFASLAKEAKLPKKVPIHIVPSSYHAEVVMFSKHASDSYTVNWKPLQQAAFVAGRIEQGDSVDEIVYKFGIKRDQVLIHVAAGQFFSLCTHVKPQLSEKAAILLEDPDQFPYSTVVERLVVPLKTRRRLGLVISENGDLLVPPLSEFLPVLVKILEEAASGSIDTRKLNDDDGQEVFLGRLGYTPSNAGSVEVKKVVSMKAVPSEFLALPSANGARSTARKNKKSPSNLRYLLPKSLVCGLENAKLHELVEEGKRLCLEDFPNSSAALLRAVLETALRISAEEMGCVRKLEAEHKCGLLDIPVQKLLSDVKSAVIFDIGLSQEEKKALVNLLGDGPLSVCMLNQYLHNKHWSASPRSVAEIRGPLLPVIQKAMSRGT